MYKGLRFPLIQFLILFIISCVSQYAAAQVLWLDTSPDPYARSSKMKTIQSVCEGVDGKTYPVFYKKLDMISVPVFHPLCKDTGLGLTTNPACIGKDGKLYPLTTKMDKDGKSYFVNHEACKDAFGNPSCLGRDGKIYSGHLQVDPQGNFQSYKHPMCETLAPVIREPCQECWIAGWKGCIKTKDKQPLCTGWQKNYLSTANCDPQKGSILCNPVFFRGETTNLDSLCINLKDTPSEKINEICLERSGKSFDSVIRQTLNLSNFDKTKFKTAFEDLDKFCNGPVHDVPQAMEREQNRNCTNLRDPLLLSLRNAKSPSALITPRFVNTIQSGGAH